MKKKIVEYCHVCEKENPKCKHSAFDKVLIIKNAFKIT